MIGVFDSGVGGLISFNELRRLMPNEDICFLADRKNAPYGTKTADELTLLVSKDIQRLRECGAEHILIACCTASTVYDLLPKKDKSISTPIIAPTAEFISRAAEKKKGRYRVTVISTQQTAASHAFRIAVNNYLHDSIVTELAVQELVSLAEKYAEGGKSDTRTEFFIDELCCRIKETEPDALVLGCTHFSHFKEEFERRLSGILTVSPAHIGANELYRKLKRNQRTAEHGRCLYTE